MSTTPPGDAGDGDDPHAGVVEEFRPDTEGPALHIYKDRQRAVERAREVSGETRVATQKRNGRQYREVQRKEASETMNGVNVEVWVTAEIEE